MSAAPVVALSRIGEGSDDADRIDLIRALEELKCSAEAAQAVLTAAFDRSQREAEARAGVPEERRGRAVAAQVALARRESPHRGRQHVGLALVLATRCRTRATAFRAGRITEWRAMLLARETACLSRADRLEVDRQVAGDPRRRSRGWATASSSAAARELAYELDPVSFVERRRRAEADRRVSLRPAPDVMSQLSTLLPVKDGVAVWAVLSREADVQRAAGDQRSRGQIMADTLVRRVLNPGEGDRSVPLMINVVVPDSVLLGDDDGFGWVEHYGPVPGDLLREWIAANAEQGVDQWVRRLYATPATGELVAMDSRSRAGSRARWPTTSGCATEAAALGGAAPRSATSTTPRPMPTAVRPARPTGRDSANTCNYAKEAIGWSASPRPGPRHTIETVTPDRSPLHQYGAGAARLPSADCGSRWMAMCSRPSQARAPASGCRSGCLDPGRSPGACPVRTGGPAPSWSGQGTQTTLVE